MFTRGSNDAHAEMGRGNDNGSVSVATPVTSQYEARVSTALDFEAEMRRNTCVASKITLFFYKNVVFPAKAEYSYFSADFRTQIFLYYS